MVHLQEGRQTKRASITGLTWQFKGCSMTSAGQWPIGYELWADMLFGSFCNGEMHRAAWQMTCCMLRLHLAACC